MDALRFFSEYQYRVPSEGELVLLNEFLKSIKDSPSRFTTASIRANDTCIAKPLFDLLKMRRAIHPKDPILCPIDKLFDTVREAADRRLVHDFSASHRRIFISHSDDGAKLSAILSGHEPELCENGICVARNIYASTARKDIKSNSEYTAVVIYPGELSGADSVLKFAKTISKSKKALSVSVSRGRDVFSGIYSLSSQLTVKAEGLAISPDTPADEVFPLIASALFTDSFFGSTAITAVCKNKHVKSIKKAAQKEGLEASAAFVITKDKKFRIFSGSRLLTELRHDTFRLLSSPELLEVDIPSVPDAEISLPNVIKLCEFADGGDAVYSVELPISKAGFKNAAIAVASLFIYAAFDGLNKKNSCFSLAFKASLDLSNTESISQAYSALASLHSISAEMGTTIDCTHTDIKDGGSSLAVCLRVARFDKKAELSSSLSKEAFLKFAFDSRNTPDFSLIKELIEG